MNKYFLYSWMMIFILAGYISFSSWCEGASGINSTARQPNSQSSSEITTGETPENNNQQVVITDLNNENAHNHENAGNSGSSEYKITINYAKVKVQYLQGTIGNLKIHMVLRIKEWSNSEWSIDGEYHYDKNKGRVDPLYIQGQINGNSISLDEFTYRGPLTGHFEGELISSNQIKGYWRNMNSTKRYALSLDTYDEYISHQPLAGFEDTQGKVVNYIAPYVEAFCKQENINQEKLITTLLGPQKKLPESETYGRYISSDDHPDPRWTYYISNTPTIYQIEILNNSNYVVLYNQKSPDELTGDDNWQVAVLDRDLKMITKKEFHIKLKNNLLNYSDYLKTDLRVLKSGKVLAIITYDWTGKAVPPPQEYTATINFNINQITSIMVEQTKGF